MCIDNVVIPEEIGLPKINVVCRYYVFSCNALVPMKKILRGGRKMDHRCKVCPPCPYHSSPYPIEEREGSKNKRYLCVFHLFFSEIW